MAHSLLASPSSHQPVPNSLHMSLCDCSLGHILRAELYVCIPRSPPMHIGGHRNAIRHYFIPFPNKSNNSQVTEKKIKVTNLQASNLCQTLRTWQNTQYAYILLDAVETCLHYKTQMSTSIFMMVPFISTILFYSHPCGKVIICYWLTQLPTINLFLSRKYISKMFQMSHHQSSPTSAKVFTTLLPASSKLVMTYNDTYAATHKIKQNVSTFKSSTSLIHTIWSVKSFW